MGGLKVVAKSTSDFIINAMGIMASAIDKAIVAIKVAVAVYQTLPVVSTLIDTAGKGFALAFADLGKMFDSQVAGIDNLLRHTLSPDSKFSDASLNPRKTFEGYREVGYGAGQGANSSQTINAGLQ